MYSCTLVFLTLTLTSPPLDPSGLAALQIPRTTRRNFAKIQIPKIHVFMYSIIHVL
jgi:hypothetical protein